MEPVLAANELHVQGELTALSAGDIEWAVVNRYQWVANHFFGGANLLTTNKKLEEAHTFVKQQGHATIMVYVIILQRTLAILLGEETETLTMDRLTEKVKDGSNRLQKVMIL
jgi:hypothetical protein